MNVNDWFQTNPPLREGWSHPAACTRGRSLRLKVILFSRFHWRSIPKEEDDLIQPLTLKVSRGKVIGGRWSYSAAYTKGRSLRKMMILSSRLHWRSIRKRWSYSAACTEGQLEKGDLIQPLVLKVNQKKVILFSRLHWRSIRTGDLIQPLALKVDPWGGRWSYSAAYTEGQLEKGDLIQPFALKVDPWGEMWSYSATYAEGRYLGKKVILFSRLHWRSIH